MPLTYAAACKDGYLFAPWFAGESWKTWQVIDKAIFGEPLNAAELATSSNWRAVASRRPSR